MQTLPYSYSIFFDFIESYLPTGFLTINRDDPIIQKLEMYMEENNQFFTVMQMEEMKFLFSSNRTKEMFGIEPEDFNPSHYLQIVEPEDIDKLGWGIEQILKVEENLFREKKGSALISYTLRMHTPQEKVIKFLRQDYLFYTNTPSSAVYAIQVVTNADWCTMKKDCFHQYVGENISLFQYPTQQLLKMANDLTKRELEILKLIEMGFCSKEIAEKLFISVHTVSTHRSNILDKSGKNTINDLIIDLEQKGLL